MGDTRSMLRYPFDFPKISGRLLRRLNRFVVEAEVDGQKVNAHLPNPGRLWELLLPGTGLLLSPALSRGKLPYTVLACQKEDRYILLHTQLTNKVIRSLIDEGRLPLFKEYRVSRAEPAWEKHRFDLLLQHRLSGEPFYLEIKSCTLFEKSTAMFPDAVTKRGAAHLLLLRELSRQGLGSGCLFVVMSPQVKYFMPADHIDLHFAQTFFKVKNSVRLNAVALGFDGGFTAVNSIKPVEIPESYPGGKLQDRGVYLLMLALKRSRTITLGKDGEIGLEEGHYLYVGPPANNLSGEMLRHRQRRKKKKEPLDHLTAAADAVTTIPIITGENLGPGLTAALEKIAGPPVELIRSSGGKEGLRLFHFSANPLHNRSFIELIQHFRIARREQKMLKAKDPTPE